MNSSKKGQDRKVYLNDMEVHALEVKRRVIMSKKYVKTSEIACKSFVQRSGYSPKAEILSSGLIVNKARERKQVFRMKITKKILKIQTIEELFYLS